MADVLAIEDDSQPEVVPLRDDQFGLVAGHAGGHGVPLLAGRRDLLERQSAPVFDLDRVPAPAGREQPQNPALEDGSVDAELRDHAPADLAAQVSDELAQERDRLLGVMDVARAG